MKQGYVALHRKIQEHPFYKEKREFSKYEAWVDILMEVQHSLKPKDVVIGMNVLQCHYGESLKSVKTWAKRWNWTESKVRRYFDLLKKMNQIRTKSEVKTTRLFVINYEGYDPKRRASDEQTKCKRSAADEQSTTDKNVKNVKKDYPEWLNVEMFELFIKDRKERKHKVTEHAIKLMITKLEKCCKGNYKLQDIIIKKSIESGWKTFYPLKNDEYESEKSQELT